MTATETNTSFDPSTEATLLAESIVAALVNSRIYELDHPRVLGSIEHVRKTVEALAKAANAPSVRLGSFDGMLVYQRRPLLGASLSVARLNERLSQLGSGGIEFDRGTPVSELTTFFAALVDRTNRDADYQQCNTRLALEKCRSVRLLPPYADGVEGGFGDPVQLGLSFHQAVIDLLQNVTVSVCRGGHIDFGPVQAQAEQVLKRLEQQENMQLGLARQDQYDAFTFGHSLRVAILSMHFARALTDDRDLLIRIGTAALLHDVGKSLIPFEILHSTKQLTPEERATMNRHAELGAECLLDHHDSDPLAIAAAFGHHRSADGSGYPRTTHEHPVSMVTNIVKICDIFEALTAARPYKQPMSPIRAYRVMVAMGDKLDQVLLKRFIEVNGVYPVGQLVELDGGDVAVVRSQTDDMLRPQVALVETAFGHELLDHDEQLIDLSDIECGCVRQILCELTPAQAGEKLRDSDEPEPQPAAGPEPESNERRITQDPFKW